MPSRCGVAGPDGASPLWQRFPVEVARRAGRKALEPPEFLVPDAFVEVRCLESVRVDPRPPAAACGAFGLKSLNETGAPPLATQVFRHPQRAEIEPAVVRISVRATEHSSSPTEPDGQRNFGAIPSEGGRAVELLEPLLEDLDVSQIGLRTHLQIEVVPSWSVATHGRMVSRARVPGRDRVCEATGGTVGRCTS
jgi:hypothetical protein